MTNKKEILRFTTAGSVDDGKSTLIGRLLYDSKSVFSDQIKDVENTSNNMGYDYIDFSLLTDGLKSEREQGITIDVAYRYFETNKRKFIIADTPGHIQYTRNMVTGASTANLALILIDARKGLLEQTHRHSFISSLLGIKHVVVCVNKMDLVGYDQDVFDKIVSDYKIFSAKLNINDFRYIPISALKGDNVVNKSSNMTWYKDAPLLNLLENIHISSDRNLIDFRFPIQHVIRPKREGYEDHRSYAGRIVSGVMKVNDEIIILPSNKKSRVKEIFDGDKSLEYAFPPMSISVTLNDDIDVSRGDMMVRSNNIPKLTNSLDLIITWLNEEKLVRGKKLILKHTVKETKCIVNELHYEIDINTLHRIENISSVQLNQIARVTLKTADKLFTDKYTDNKGTGSIILIDPMNLNTVGAGMII